MDEGVIVRWNDERGFGFLRAHHNGDDVFVHVSAFANRSRRPVIGDRVRYSVTRDAHGKIRAESVLFLGERSRSRSGPSLIPVIVVMLFLASLAYLTMSGSVPPWIIVWYGLSSSVAVVLYWRDKSAARAGRWRLPEAWLQLVGLIGGWPGSLVAQNRLRHKSRKMEFLAVFWITVVANVAGLWWLLSPRGAVYLNQITRFIDAVSNSFR